MLISSKSEYGLRAMMDITVHGGNAPVGRSGIAERQQIPLPYLTQVLRSLVNGGLLASTRGPSGGYRLNRDPEQISLLDVITLLQGPVSPASCGTASQHGDCHRQSACGLAGVWSRLQSASEDVLRQTSLKSIVEAEGQVTAASHATGEGPQDTAAGMSDEDLEADHRLDCIGAACPLPIVRISEEMRRISAGQVLEVWADDEGSKADIPAWCMGTGNEFLGREEFGKQMKFLIRKVV